MERNTRTTIGALEDGDRFYLLADKRKEVWTKVARAIKKTGYQTYGHFAIKDGGNSKYPQAFNKETSVVFLRHKNYYHDQYLLVFFTELITYVQKDMLYPLWVTLFKI